MGPLVVVLLDNAYTSDRRAAWLYGILRELGARVRVVAWDRRVSRPEWPDPDPAPGEEVVRIAAPAPWGAGRGTLTALGTYTRGVLDRRHELMSGADAVIASNLYMLPLGRALAARARVPLIYEAREDWAVLEAARFPRVLRNGVTRVETALGRGAGAVIVPGEVRAHRWRRVGVEPVILRNFGATSPRNGVDVRWDVVSVGVMAEQRRLDLLLELARCRPDLRIGLGGQGRLAAEVRAAAEELANVEYVGFVEDVDATLAQGRVIVYGEDPESAYSPLVCPNTLYQAVRLRRPLVFYCAGEPEEAVRRYRIGIRCAASVEALSAAVDTALVSDGWQFDEAWAWLHDGAEDAFRARVRTLGLASA